MRIIPLKTYSEFKKQIPAKFRTSRGLDKGEKVRNFRKVVGREAARFRVAHMFTNGSEDFRHSRWQDWIGKIHFDEAWATIQDIDDDVISQLEGKQRNIEFYLAVYYRFHSILEHPTFSDAIDDLVFDGQLRDYGDPVFIEEVELNEKDPFRYLSTRGGEGKWLKILSLELCGFGKPRAELPSVRVGSRHRFLVDMPSTGYFDLLSFSADHHSPSGYSAYYLTDTLGVYRKELQGVQLLPPPSLNGVEVGGQPSVSTLVGICSTVKLSAFLQLNHSPGGDPLTISFEVLWELVYEIHALGDNDLQVCTLDYAVNGS